MQHKNGYKDQTAYRIRKVVKRNNTEQLNAYSNQPENIYQIL